MSSPERDIDLIQGALVDTSDELALPPEEFELRFGVSTDTTPNMDRIVKVAKESTPANIVMTILEETGLAPDKEEAAQAREFAQEIWRQSRGVVPPYQQEEFNDLSALAASYDSVEQLVNDMDVKQRHFWDDYEKRQGQNIDTVMALYDSTDAYADGSLLRTFESLFHRLPVDERLQDAERIARLLILEHDGHSV